MPFIIFILFLCPLNLQAVEDLRLKIQTAKNILQSYQPLQMPALSDFSSKEVISSYEELLEMATSTLKLSEDISSNSSLYNFYNSLLEPVSQLVELEQKERELYTHLLDIIRQKNQHQYQKDNLFQEQLQIQKQRGHLSDKELSYFIQQAMQNPALSPASLEEQLQKMIPLISSSYEQWDQERDKLLQNSHLLAFILCPSQVYKADYKGDCFFALENQEELLDFLDSLSPQRWRELLEIFENTDDYQSYAQFFNPGQSLADALWDLSSQEQVYRGYKQAFMQADFYRWVYFVLRKKVRAGDGKETFSWDMLREEWYQETRPASDSQETGFLVEELVIQTEQDRLEGLLLETQTEYFQGLSAVSILFETQQAQLPEDSACQDQLRLSNQKACFEEILNSIQNWENQQTELKKQRDKNIQRIIHYAPIIIQNMEEQLTQ